METVPVLKCSAHFLIGFVLGYFLFRLVLHLRKGHYRVSIYAPLLPFLVAILFVIPCLFDLFGIGELQYYIGSLVNIFGAYGWLHHSSYIPPFLGDLNLVVLIYGLFFLLIVQHYIQLIKRLRASQTRVKGDDDAG